MFVRYSILIALAFAFIARAETIISQSQQFVVHHSGANVTVAELPRGCVEVEPELLVVTAERIKQAVTSQLPALNGNRTQIHITMLDSGNADSMIGIASSRFADAWRYEVAVPRVVEEGRLVKGFINVLLLEYANRTADRSAELPAWVTEGLAEQLLFSIGPKLVVTRVPNGWEASARDLNHWTRETLRTNATPSFHDLTTAAVPSRKSEKESIYLAGTHLLVHSLLEMPNGRQHFANFVQLLPRTWNWQTAFLQAFGFSRMLDVEKWWALTLVEFTTRDQRQAWSGDMSLRKLDELLQTRVEIRNATNAMPELRLVDLNAILQERDATLQRQAIDAKISQLSYTAPHMAPHVAALALSYKTALETFLKKRTTLSFRPGLRTTAEAQYQGLVAETTRHIAGLDEKRRALALPTVTAAR